jgi:hypothetical protein
MKDAASHLHYTDKSLETFFKESRDGYTEYVSDGVHCIPDRNVLDVTETIGMAVKLSELSREAGDTPETTERLVKTFLDKESELWNLPVAGYSHKTISDLVNTNYQKHFTADKFIEVLTPYHNEAPEIVGYRLGNELIRNTAEHYAEVAEEFTKELRT